MSLIETELKFILDRQSFRLLYGYLKGKGYKPHLTRQVNYYFATSKNIPALHLASIRIRYVQGRYELTCKIPINKTTTDTIQNSYEYNINISREKALNYINQGLSVHTQRELFGDMFRTHGLPIAHLFCFGHLRTGRFAFTLKDDLPALLLDTNAYLGVFDYEIEWELKQVETANTLLQNIFDELEIQPMGKMTPKVKRFFYQIANR
jgi:uncharacterized protein YjbK